MPVVLKSLGHQHGYNDFHVGGNSFSQYEVRLIPLVIALARAGSHVEPTWANIRVLS